MSVLAVHEFIVGTYRAGTEQLIAYFNFILCTVAVQLANLQLALQVLLLTKILISYKWFTRHIHSILVKLLSEKVIREKLQIGIILKSMFSFFCLLLVSFVISNLILCLKKIVSKITKRYA